jgi:hypothetical protein
MNDMTQGRFFLLILSIAKITRAKRISSMKRFLFELFHSRNKIFPYFEFILEIQTNRLDNFVPVSAWPG